MKSIPLRTALLGLFLAGCNLVPPPQADTTRYYVLSAPAASVPEAAPGALRLGLKELRIADYLDTRDIVVRKGANELVLQDYARWAEPLESGIGRVLRARLLSDPGIAAVSSPPFAIGVPRDYDLTVEILHCEGDSDSARFAARVEIASAADGHVVARRVFVAPQGSWNGRDFGKLAALLSEDVSALGADIAGALLR